MSRYQREDGRLPSPESKKSVSPSSKATLITVGKNNWGSAASGAPTSKSRFSITFGQNNYAAEPQLRDLDSHGESEAQIYDNPNNVETDLTSVSEFNPPPPPPSFVGGPITEVGSRITSHHSPMKTNWDDDFDENGTEPSVHNNRKTRVQGNKNGGDYGDNDGNGCFTRSFLTCCCVIIILALIIALIAALGPKGGFLARSSDGGSKSPTGSPTFFPTKNPTTHPTGSPVAPTRTPTNSPSNAPTSSPTKTPTSSPTNGPTSTPTQAPTSTLSFISGVCAGSKERTRTSMCLDANTWVRCEVDGSVVHLPGSDDFVRSCEPGDACPCEHFKRVAISDPCVLGSKETDSFFTCAADD